MRISKYVNGGKNMAALIEQVQKFFDFISGVIASFFGFLENISEVFAGLGK